MMTKRSQTFVVVFFKYNKNSYLKYKLSIFTWHYDTHIVFGLPIQALEICYTLADVVHLMHPPQEKMLTEYLLSGDRSSAVNSVKNMKAPKYVFSDFWLKAVWYLL